VAKIKALVQVRFFINNNECPIQIPKENLVTDFTDFKDYFIVLILKKSF
jgi:hypothetical protein